MIRTRTTWMALLAFAIVLLVPALCFADDCARDPFNAADCMRSNGYRQFIIVAISVLATLGSIIASIVGAVPTTPGTQPAEPGEPMEPGLDVPPVGEAPPGLGGPGDNPNTSFDEPPSDCSIGLPTWRVNTATLNLVILDIFFRYEGMGPPIELELVYNALDNERGLFGLGWRCSYEWRVVLQGNVAYVRKGSGQTLVYRFDAPPGPQGPAEAVSLGPQPERLFDHGGHFILVVPSDRTLYRFDKLHGNPLAPLTGITDRNECTVRLTWNPDGTLGAIHDAAGRATTFSYDANRLCTAFRTPDGRTARLDYEAGRLAHTVDLAGIPVHYQYDAQGPLSRMVVGHERATTTFGYQQGPRGPAIAWITSPTGDTTRYEWAAQGAVRLVDPQGKATTYESYEGMTQRITNPLGAALTFTYHQGRRVALQDPDGSTFRMEYDVVGRLTRVVDPTGAASTRVYDEWDRLTAMTDATGYTKKFHYDPKSNLAGTETSDGRAHRFEMDRAGLLVGWIDPNGARTTFTHDRFGNVASRTDPVGGTTRYDWGEHGVALLAVTDPEGRTTRFERDGNGRTTRMTFADGFSRSMTYACNAGMTVTDEEGRTTRFERDAGSIVRKVFEADGATSEATYDPAGRLIELQDALRRTTTFSYDDAGRLVSQTDPQRGVARMERSRSGELLSVQDAKGARITYQRDGVGRLIQLTDGIGAAVKFSYDPAGRPVGMINARGQRVEVRRAPDGAPVAMTHDGASIASYSYDVCGRLTRIQDGSGTTALQWDVAGRPKTVKYPGGHAAQLTYDAAGRVRTIGYPGGLAVEYTRDARGRISRIAWGRHHIGVEYSPTGNIRAETRSNGTRSEYACDAADRMTSVRHLAGGNVMADLRVEYDAVGNVTLIRGEAPVVPGSGSLQRNFFHDARNAISHRDGTPLEHDADGNLVGDAGRGWRARYDAQNRLIEVERQGRVRRCSYDGLFRRSKVESDAGVRQYHYDPMGRLLFETDQAGAVIACYVYRDEQLVARIVEGRSWFYHFDALGSTIAITDGTGRVIAAYAYGPFGEISSRLGALDNPFTYVGAYGVMDDGDGLYYMRHRHYDAALGRFLQRDPMGIDGGLNLYAYVGNNPATHIDPLGLFEWATWAELTIGAATTYMIVSPDPIAKTLLIGAGTVKAVGVVGAGLVGLYSTYTAVQDIRHPNTAAGENSVLEGHVKSKLIVKDPDGTYRFNPNPDDVIGPLPFDYQLKKIQESIDKHNVRVKSRCEPPAPKKHWWSW